jgi:TRAP-type C4-dicarboxylate transport system substrate-binding protein
MKRGKMKLLFTVLLCFAMIALTAACGSNEPAGEETVDTGEDAVTEEQVSTQEPVIWNVGTINTDPAVSDTYNAEGHALALFAEKVNEYTNGAITVNVHWCGTLGAKTNI